MAGGVQHHCPKRRDSGKNCRITHTNGKTYCSEHEILCKRHNIPTLKNRSCYKCLKEIEVAEKKKKEEQDKAKDRKGDRKTEPEKKKKYKKNYACTFRSQSHCLEELTNRKLT
ncbi:hypothetical protein K449DRAFT_394125 [Hypoxylon sp. EC38]|nr:hypothetical protein K449DRAFT_394125 [Hypoxylon sp. EC38]